jgi:hypothetical protein
MAIRVLVVLRVASQPAAHRVGGLQATDMQLQVAHTVMHPTEHCMSCHVMLHIAKSVTAPTPCMLMQHASRRLIYTCLTVVRPNTWGQPEATLCWWRQWWQCLSRRCMRCTGWEPASQRHPRWQQQAGWQWSCSQKNKATDRNSILYSPNFILGCQGGSGAAAELEDEDGNVGPGSDVGVGDELNVAGGRHW